MTLLIYVRRHCKEQQCSVAGIHSAGIDISYEFLKTHLYTVYTYLGGWHKVFATMVVSSTNGRLMEHPNGY